MCNQNYRLSKQKTRYQLGYVPIGNEFFINNIIYLFQKRPCDLLTRRAMKL